MTLPPGTRLGPYEIVSPLGAGGMGEVYRARDARLGRDVAVKVLPHAVADDPERLARFAREAQALAALSHPNIGAIYGVEESAGATALVLELVEGPTLAERLAAGALPLAEALAVARQIADALAAAHERAIVHRDLKPANVKLRPDGTVKVLDFGLAKLDAGAASGELSTAPTVDMATRTGTVVGTAPYMSPEQARGQPIDRRTDLWALGVVLFEMLAGRSPFAAATVADTLVAVVEREPPWSALPATTPPHVLRLLRRCLAKDARQRLRDAGDARLELDEAPASESSAVGPAVAAHRRHPGRREVLAWTLAVLALAALLVLARWRPVAISTPPAIRSSLLLPADLRLPAEERGYPLALSPDGASLVFEGEKDGATQLYLRALGEATARPLAGTEGAQQPFFSPDGAWVGFFAGGSLQRVAIAGGAPLAVCDVAQQSLGGAWAAGDTLVYATAGGSLWRVPVAGGTPRPIPGTDGAAWPDVLPDGRTVLFTQDSSAFAAVPLDGGAVRTVAAASGSSVRGPAVLGAGGNLHQARWVSSGHLLYGQSPGMVRALPFDLAALRATGTAVSLVDAIERAPAIGAVYFAVARSGLRVEVPTGNRHRLEWVARDGSEHPLAEERAAFRQPRLAPDGRHAVVAINDPATRRSDLWIYDTERGTRRRLTTARHNLSPVWSPDGATIAYADGRLTQLASDGSGGPHAVFEGRVPVYPSSWSPDGRALLFDLDEPTGSRVWQLARGGAAGPFAGGLRGGDAQVSPDGRWVAYVSDESGRTEVYVGRFPDLAGKVAASTRGGGRPRWARNGRELFYRQGDAVMAVAIDGDAASPRPQPPRQLFSGPFNGAAHDGSFDVSPDGSRFLMVRSDEAATLRVIDVVQGWPSELRGLAPAPR